MYVNERQKEKMTKNKIYIMKNFNLIKRLWTDSHEKQSPQRFARYAAMLIMLLTLGVGQMWGAGQCSYHWKGKVYFRAPNSWDLSTYKYTRLGVARTTDTNTNTYQDFFGQMTQISNTRLFYLSTDADHSGWGQCEYIFFTTNEHKDYGSGTFKVNNSHYYTVPKDYGCNNSSNYYLFNPSSDTGGPAVNASWDDTRNDLFKLSNTIAVKVKKAGSDSYTTPSNTTEMPATTISVRGYYLNGDNSSTYNDKSLSGSTYSTTFYGCPGGKITLSQTAKDGYTFDGFYVSSSEVTSPYYPTSGSAITIEARYTEIASTVTLTASPSGKGSFTIGGAAATSTSVGVTTTKSVTAVPASGYHFVSWAVSGGATISNTTDNPVTVTGTGAGTAATLTATFAEDAANYTITYGVGTSYTSYGSVTEGHSYASGSSQTSGTEISLTATPVTHYKLEGWYSDAACSSAIAGAGTTNPYEFTLGANTSVYAKFVLKQCTITLDRNGGSAGATSVTASHGQTLPAFTAHTRTGYTLNGYYTETSGGTKIINADGSLVASTSYANGSKQWNSDVTTLTLHAQWTEVKSTVSLVASPTGAGTFTSNASTVTSLQAGVTTKPSVTANPAFGYSFSSWAVSGGATISSTSSNPTTVTGKGAGAAATLTATFARTYSYMQGRMSIYNAARNSKTHIASSEGGWDTNSTRIGLDYDDTNHRFVLHTHMKPSELTAQQNSEYQWFKIKNGSTTYAPTSDTQITTAGTKYSASSSGSGSYRINNSATSGYVVLHFDGSDVWYTLEQRLQYSKNGGTGSNPTGANGHNSYHATGTNATAANNPYTRTGYTFASWNTKSNGNGTNYAEGANVPMSADVTLYAKWTANNYTVVLDKQTSAKGYGGNEGTVANQTVTFDATPATVSGTMPTAAQGYGFMGFYSAENGEGRQFINPSGEWVTSAGDTISGGKWVKPAGITLYAYYKKAEITALTLDAVVVETNATVGVTPTVSPTPEGTTKLWFYVFHGNDNPLDPQPAITWNGTKATFKAGGTSGTYKIGVALRTGTTYAGTLLDSTTVSYQVAGTHSVTVRYKCGDDVIKAATTLDGIRPLDWSDAITAPEIIGYSFTGWSAGDGVTLTDDDGSSSKTSTATATIKIKAIYDGYLTANYSKKRIIYFNNTLNWENVYVYFYKNGTYWNDTYGTGCNKTYGFTNTPFEEGLYGQMLPVEEGSKIYYFDAEAAGVNASYQTVVFTELDQHTYDWFAKTGDVKNKVIKRDDYYSTKLPMYVPLTVQTPVSKNDNKADYYRQGYWMNYPENTGYTLKIYNKKTRADAPDAGSKDPIELKSIPFEFTADKTMPMELDVDLEAGQTYGFKIWRNDGLNTGAGSFYGNTGTMTANAEGWDMKTTASSNAGLQTTAAGSYKFSLNYYAVNSDYQYRVSVTYPVASGDYRLLYKDDVHTKWHPSAVIPKAKAKDTVSFFVRTGQHAYLKLQKCTGLGAGTVTWTDTVTWWNNGTGIHSAVTQDSVYNICLKHNASTGKLEIENVEVYTGKFYIRTDCANSKWDNWKSDPDHLMTYSEYSINHGGYSHYYCHWVTTADAGRKNVKFVIANDYSPCISDTLTRESNAAAPWTNINSYIDSYGNILRNANVRFMWNQHTNTISRAYVDGAQNVGSDNFLYMLNTDSPNKIKWADGTSLTSNKVTFTDNGNWIYEANVKAQPNAAIKLLSNWGTSSPITQYFKGSSSTTEPLIGGSGTGWYDIRVIYDYKTNRLVSAWIPSGDISDEIEINADVMFIREHQGDIAQLTFSDDGIIKKIETAYGVLCFNKWTLNNKDKSTHSPLASPLSRYERDLFYVSFPFKVAMSEVFGFGTYGTHWIIEEYDGANRAAKGYWAESAPNWKFVLDRKGKFFEPNQGYIIALELDELGESSSIWDNTEQVELYFPSYGTMPNITNSTVNCTIPEHLCTINRSEEIGGSGLPLGPEYDRRVKDSHWNVISVPTYLNTSNASFANTAWITAGDGHVGPNFLYEWNPDDNTVTARSGVGYTYKAMHAYLVQYCGVITWTTSVSPAAAPRRNPAYRGNYEFRLEMLQNEESVDQTFVKLSDNEAVTTGFEFNYDLSKEFNKNRSNIYTLIGTEPAAGNVLPLTDQTTVVPVGVIAKTDGDYTFSIPDGTEGIGVTLIDNETGIRTSLSAVDYTINLSAGTYDDRFLLEISPIKHVATGIETVNEEGAATNGARKIMIDGLLYIVKDGKVFDAQGRQVK